MIRLSFEIWHPSAPGEKLAPQIPNVSQLGLRGHVDGVSSGNGLWLVTLASFCHRLHVVYLAYTHWVGRSLEHECWSRRGTWPKGLTLMIEILSEETVQ